MKIRLIKHRESWRFKTRKWCGWRPMLDRDGDPLFFPTQGSAERYGRRQGWVWQLGRKHED